MNRGIFFNTENNFTLFLLENILNIEIFFHFLYHIDIINMIRIP